MKTLQVSDGFRPGSLFSCTKRPEASSGNRLFQVVIWLG